MAKDEQRIYGCDQAYPTHLYGAGQTMRGTAEHLMEKVLRCTLLPKGGNTSLRFCCDLPYLQKCLLLALLVLFTHRAFISSCCSALHSVSVAHFFVLRW